MSAADASVFESHRLKNRLRIAVATLLTIYWIGLTLGLVLTNPFAVAGARSSWLSEFYRRHLSEAAHFVAFAGLSSLFVALLLRARRLRDVSWRTWVLAGLALTTYAAVTEIIQIFVPRRTAEWQDFAQNLAGIAVGAGLAIVATRLRLRWLQWRQAQRLPEPPAGGAPRRPTVR